jgi:UMP-CMP kinase
MPNTFWIEVSGSGTPECDGLYCPSKAAPKKSESGTMSSLGYWNGKYAWDRVDGKAERNPSISFSDSYKQWRIARLDGHLAYTTPGGDTDFWSAGPWGVYKKAVAPAPTVTIHESDPRLPNVVFVLGGPGAGKGTMCEVAEAQLGWCHLSAGDLLRDERKKGGAQADMINDFIKEGKIVPVEVTVGLIKKAMDASGKQNFLIDGFPRSLENFSGWEKVIGDAANVRFMLFFECPLPILEQRILGRAKYSGRSDDNIESLRKRFNTYKTETMPIVEVFRKEGKCVEIDTSQKREVVYEIVKSKLATMTESMAAQPLTDR